MAAAVAFFSGLLFALGLGLSGMTQPAKVLAFLDIGGAWDPSLAMVMIGAIAVHATSYRIITRRPSPLLGGHFGLPSSTQLDAKLLGGAALFGVGWGIAGYCPGPALTAIGGGSAAALTFVPAMLGGMFVHSLIDKRMSRADSREQPAPT